MKKRNAIAAAEFEAGLAKREIRTIEHHEKFDLAEGDRKRIGELSLDVSDHTSRITELENVVAELSERLKQLLENSAVPLVPQDDGSLAARVGQLEEFAVAFPEFTETLNSLHGLMDAMARKQNVLASGIKESHDRITQLRHDTTQSLCETVFEIERIAGGG